MVDVFACVLGGLLAMPAAIFVADLFDRPRAFKGDSKCAESGDNSFVARTQVDEGYLIPSDYGFKKSK